MINRREFLGTTLGAGATLSFTPELLRALQQSNGKLIQRAIPSSGEMLPVVGLTFANHAGCADPAALKEVLKTFADNGGKVFDAMHVSAAATEQFHATVADELRIQSKLFWSTRGTPPGGGGGAPELGPTSVKTHVEMWLARLKVPRLDLVMLPPQGDPMHLDALKAMKKQGLVRYIGVQVINAGRYPELEAAIRKEPIDFIGVDYNVERRLAEQTILPLAQERKIGVMAFMPFSGANGASCTGGKGLFGRVGTAPLPEWASEFDARTWAQFFLKYVISHPAVTATRVGTTKVHHMLDNIGGGIGRLPNEAMRKRMAEHIDAFPGAPAAPQPIVAVAPAILDRYVGEYKSTAGAVLIFRRNGTQLLMKMDTNPEVPLYGRAETRFFFGPTGIEFLIDSTGTVTGLVLDQSGQKTSASRVR